MVWLSGLPFLHPAYTRSKDKAPQLSLEGLSSFVVGVVGFEPTTPCSQSRYANRTALHPEQTIRPKYRGFSRRGGDSNPRYQLTRYGSLANCWFQPLTHLSNTAPTFWRAAKIEACSERRSPAHTCPYFRQHSARSSVCRASRPCGTDIIMRLHVAARVLRLRSRTIHAHLCASGPVAQWIEQLPSKQPVVGSIPTGVTTLINRVIHDRSRAQRGSQE